MTTRTKIITSVVLLAISFASGRFLSPTKTKTEIKTVEVEKIVVKVERVVTTIREKPDGTKETVIVADTKTDSKTNSVTTDDLKEVTNSRSNLNVSVLAGSGFPISGTSLVYGASVTKQIIGPFTATAWGLSNLSGGIGIGLNF